MGPRERGVPKGAARPVSLAEATRTGRAHETPEFSRGLPAWHVTSSPVSPILRADTPKQRLSKPVVFELEEETKVISVYHTITLPQPSPPIATQTWILPSNFVTAAASMI